MATYNTEWEQALFAEMNRVRADPAAYAQELKQLKSAYDGVFFVLPVGGQTIETEEGIAALNHAIRSLEKQKPLSPFRKISLGLSKAASLLCNDNNSSGSTSNRLADGTTAQERWVKFGQWKGKVGENICYMIADPRDIVQQWIIDDGQGNRPHRKSVLSPDFTCVGIAHGPHSAHRCMCVVTFATAFIDGAPGKAPKVGSGSGGVSTTQSHQRSTEESLIEGSGDDLVLETDVSDCLDTSKMKLIARGKMLKLTRTVGSGTRKKTKASSWQVPFMVNPATVNAKVSGGKLIIRLPPPPVGAEASGVGDRVVLGKYTLTGGGSLPKVDVDVSQTKEHIKLTAARSKFDEEVTVISEGDVIIFECEHQEMGTTSRGQNVLQAVKTAQPLKLPFLVKRENISVDASNGLSVTVMRPNAAQKTATEVVIPIQ